MGSHGSVSLDVVSTYWGWTAASYWSAWPPWLVIPVFVGSDILECHWVVLYPQCTQQVSWNTFQILLHLLMYYNYTLLWDIVCPLSGSITLQVSWKTWDVCWPFGVVFITKSIVTPPCVFGHSFRYQWNTTSGDDCTVYTHLARLCKSGKVVYKCRLTYYCW